MFEKIEICPVCNSADIENFIICQDHMLTKESFAITKCKECSFLFTNPRPVADQIGKYYQSEEYISHTGKIKDLTSLIYKIAKYKTLSAKLNLVRSLTKNRSILDFGCGTGDFLKTCLTDSWEIYGYEPDEKARKIAETNTGKKINFQFEDLKTIPKIDIITLWHVLEHIHELNPTIRLLKSKMAKNCKLLIAVPNAQSYDAAYYKEFWAAYDVPRHLYHFTQKTMKQLLHNHGLKIHQIIPMKLDSFYVSLLSEKYKTGNQNYINSFINGYKSNSYANKHNNNYSSLIYIAGK